MSYHTKLIAGGKVALPASLRRDLGLADGDSIVIERDGNAIRIKSHAEVVREVQTLVKSFVGVGSVDDFIAERRREATREE